MMVRFLLLLLVLATPLNAAKIKRVEERSTLEIKTPALAERQVGKVRLSNGLEALLISDPEADLSAAALAVEAGSWQDPLERPGLAHYCEHMLFLGSLTYPSETGFRSYIDDRGGKFNAYTADRHTNYMFAVTHGDFCDAIDRFSHFFIDPAFTASALDREVNAVDQEYARTLEHDGWRGEMVRKTLSQEGHPDSRFNIGNCETLGGTSSDEVRQWYEGHYSSELMHLAIISPLPLDQLEKLVAEKFSRVPQRNLERFDEPSPQVDPDYLGSIVYVKPHMDRREVDLIWEMPYDYEIAIEGHAGHLISFILGHEGPGSLTERLKSQGWIQSLSTGERQYRRPETKQSQFVVSIALTNKGLAARDEVVAEVYRAIDLIRQEGVPSHIFDEIQQMARLDYEFQSRTDPFEQVQTHTQAMIGEALETYPQKSLLASRFSPKEIATQIEMMTPERALTFVTAPASETRVQFDKRNPWTGLPYHIEKPTREQLALWTGARADGELLLPGINPYIPSDVALIYNGKSERSFPKPERIASSEGGELFYALDQHFLVPEIYARFEIISSAVVEGDPRTAVLSDLLALSVRESLGTTSYLAHLGGLSYSLRPSHFGLSLLIGGYNERAPELMRSIVAELRGGIPSREQFETYKEMLAHRYRNFERETPIDQGRDLLEAAIYKNHISPGSKAEAIALVNYNDLVDFFGELTSQSYLRGLVFGNASEQEALELWAILSQGAQSEPYLAGKGLRRQVVVLPESRGPFFLEKQIANQGNAVLLAVQRGDFTFEKRAAQQILSMGMETPFFDELRTKQQTGYVVRTWDGSAEDRLFQYFAVQSNSHDSRDLLARFELMIEEFDRNLTDGSLPKERFETIRHALVERLSAPASNQQQMGELLSLFAFEKEADFDYLEKRIEATKELTYERFVELSKEFLSKENKGRLGILIHGLLPEQGSLRYERLSSESRLGRIATYTPTLN